MRYKLLVLAMATFLTAASAASMDARILPTITCSDMDHSGSLGGQTCGDLSRVCADIQDSYVEEWDAAYGACAICDQSCWDDPNGWKQCSYAEDGHCMG